MNPENLPTASFINPNGDNRGEVERLSRRILDLILQRATTAGNRQPLPEVNFSDNLIAVPDSPVSEDELLESLSEILSGSMNPGNPGYIGHMDTMPTTVSILGDLAAASINNNMLSLEMSPVLSRLEQGLLRELAKLFGFGDAAGGVMLAGGSLANLQALAVARNSHFASLEKGISRLEKQPVFFASEVAHTSLQKASMILGLGTEGVVKIAVNNDSQMNADDLTRKIDKARAEGKAPFCIVGTAGTTTTGNIDPLARIAEIAAAERLWYHVDAAHGGALIFSPKYKDKLDGIERADSITFNPQKWLYVAKTCAMVLFKKASVLRDSFRVAAPYMKETAGFTNIGEISVQGTHHADILKLWLSLRHIGKSGYAHLLEESCKLARHFFAQIKKRKFLQTAGNLETNIVCFRFAPATINESETDYLNIQLQQYLLNEGRTFFSLPVYHEKRWLRAVLLNPFIDEAAIDAVFTFIDDFAARFS